MSLQFEPTMQRKWSYVFIHYENVKSNYLSKNQTKGKKSWNLIFSRLNLIEKLQTQKNSLTQWFPKSAPRTTSGPRIPIKINILCFADHQMILSGPRTGKVGEPTCTALTTCLILPYFSWDILYLRYITSKFKNRGGQSMNRVPNLAQESPWTRPLKYFFNTISFNVKQKCNFQMLFP